MEISKFISDFEQAIEIKAGSIQAESEFKTLDNWDSLCVLSVIAMVDDVYQVTLGGEDLESATTISDLWTLISGRR